MFKVGEYDKNRWGACAEISNYCMEHGVEYDK